MAMLKLLTIKRAARRRMIMITMVTVYVLRRAHHPRMDMCMAKVIDDGGGVISSFVGMVRTAASGRDDRDPNVHYGDKVVVWTDLEGGRYLRATSLVGWLMFCQV